MPEYRAPAVYVEETSFRSKPIEGVGTSTAAFVGMTRRGPVSSGTSGVTPPLLTSFPDFERIYGGLDDLMIGCTRMTNHVAHAARAFFANRGIRVRGARTLSSDPEWKYVNVRRYFLYLEASIDRGTQWAVFEANDERLWANIRSTISGFLHNEWVNGALAGATPMEAFFVRCDRSTMTQNDLDHGRLVCLIGVVMLKPAEFVIFRIGQKTADSAD